MILVALQSITTMIVLWRLGIVQIIVKEMKIMEKLKKHYCITTKNSIMTPSVPQLTITKIISFTNTNANDRTRGKQFPTPPPG